MSKATKSTPKPVSEPAKEQAKPVLSIIKDIQRQTRKQYSAEEKIRIVLEGLQGESSIAEICRREGINPNIYYRWSKEFLEAGKKRVVGDKLRGGTSRGVEKKKNEDESFKKHGGGVGLEKRIVKKKLKGGGEIKQNKTIK